MYNFQQRKKIRKMLTSRWAFAMLVFVTLLFIKGAWGVHLKVKESEESLVKVHENLRTSGDREKELSTSIEQLKTPEGVEREIRGKFNVAKRGEEVIMVVDEKGGMIEDTPTQFPWYTRFGHWIVSLF